MLSGAAYSYAIGTDGKNSVDEVVLKAVLTRLTDALFSGQRRISDEHVSSGDESSSSEQGAPGWLRWLAHLIKGIDTVVMSALLCQRRKPCLQRGSANNSIEK